MVKKSKENKKQRRKNNIKCNPLFTIPTVLIQIKPTKHSIEKFKIRDQKLDLSDKEAKNIIVNSVKYSRLNKYGENGEEHRINKGKIFICKREKQTGIEKLIVITIKLTNSSIKQNFSRSYTFDDVDFSKIQCNKPMVS